MFAHIILLSNLFDVILPWSAMSSADSMGVDILSTVRNAAKFAVYDEIMMSVKNHQTPPTMRVEAALGFRSDLDAAKAAVYTCPIMCTNYRTIRARLSFKGPRVLIIL
jgi:hypothetical protein